MEKAILNVSDFRVMSYGTACPECKTGIITVDTRPGSLNEATCRHCKTVFGIHNDRKQVSYVKEDLIKPEHRCINGIYELTYDEYIYENRMVNGGQFEGKISYLELLMNHYDYLYEYKERLDNVKPYIIEKKGWWVPEPKLAWLIEMNTQFSKKRPE